MNTRSNRIQAAVWSTSALILLAILIFALR